MDFSVIMEEFVLPLLMSSLNTHSIFLKMRNLALWMLAPGAPFFDSTSTPNIRILEPGSRLLLMGLSSMSCLKTFVPRLVLGKGFH